MPRRLLLGTAAGLALAWLLHPRHCGGLEGPRYPLVEALEVAIRYRPATLVAPPGRFSAPWKGGAEASAHVLVGVRAGCIPPHQEARARIGHTDGGVGQFEALHGDGPFAVPR